VGAAALLAATQLPKVTLSAPGHAPKINVHWPYTVHATSGGKPVAARLTAQIVDPVGGVHAVEFGKSTRKIVNWPFKGTFSDFVVWPASSRGVPLTFRVTVRVGAVKKVVSYQVIPRS
jgi:hypothetical protein